MLDMCAFRRWFAFWRPLRCPSTSPGTPLYFFEHRTVFTKPCLSGCFWCFLPAAIAYLSWGFVGFVADCYVCPLCALVLIVHLSW